MKNIISTSNLDALPGIKQLKQLCQSIALLDAILEPNWEFRYYSYNSKWAPDEELASMRDGSGDSYFILFNQQGVIVKGYSHESILGKYAAEHGYSYPGILEQVPSDFQNFVEEPAFSMEETSFCAWRKWSDNSWSKGDIISPIGDDPDGSKDLLFILDGDPSTYQKWAETYYDKMISLEAIEAIYRHAPLTDGLIVQLNPTLTTLSIKEDIAEIDYP